MSGIPEVPYTDDDFPEDLRNYIPGVGFIKPEIPPEPVWKTDPHYHKTYIVGGSVERLYTIGALALALDKRTVTIRKWLRLNIIPEPGMRTAGIPGTLGDAGRRLFTEEQILAIVRIAREEGVAGTRQRPVAFEKTAFSARVWGLWRQKEW